MSAAASVQPAEPRTVGALRLDGTPVAPLDDPDASVVVLFFVEPECPISNRYAPEIARLARDWREKGVRIWMVYPEAGLAPEAIRAHLRAHDLEIDALRDPAHALVRAAGAQVTPEAAVFVRGERRYAGRIDDRAADFGVFRAVARERTVAAAVDAVLAGRPVATARVPGVGCVIADLSRKR